MRIVREDIFGPVSVVWSFDDTCEEDLSNRQRRGTRSEGPASRTSRCRRGATNAWRGPGSNQLRIGNDQSRIKSNQNDSYTEPSDRGETELKALGANASEQGGESENEVADALELNMRAHKNSRNTYMDCAKSLCGTKILFGTMRKLDGSPTTGFK